MCIMDSRPIGIMDSGSGGISIYEALRKELPREQFIYIGDHACVPYSDKSKSFIKKRVTDILASFIAMNVKCIVIACNTATVVGIDHYRKKFPDIPIIGVVPVIKTAVALTKTKCIAVISTPVTTKSTYQRNLIKKFAHGVSVITLGNNRIVALIEKGSHGAYQSIREDITAMKKDIENRDVDVIVLGCTHFPLVRNEFERIFGKHVSVIDSGAAVARHVRRICEGNESLSDAGDTNDLFFTSGDPISTSRLFSSLLGRPTVVRSVRIA
jgi:glutamate racemase